VSNPAAAIAGQLTLIALVIGTATAVAATGRVTISLVVSTTIVWSFVPLLQLLTGWLLLVRDLPRDRGSALAEYVRTHRYWSLWMLAVAAVLLLAPSPGLVTFPLVATALAPMFLTSRALVGLRRAWGNPPREAIGRVVAHQAMTLGLMSAYVVWATALLPRIEWGAP
jgi:hypothetical protein